MDLKDRSVYGHRVRFLGPEPDSESIKTYLFKLLEREKAKIIECTGFRMQLL